MTISLDLYHINYLAVTTIICKSIVLEFNIWEISQRNLLRFIAQTSVVNNMYIQSTWAYALIVQAFADALNVSIQMVKSNPGFSPITTVNPVQVINSLSAIITIGRHTVLLNITMYQWLPHNQMPPFQCIIKQQLLIFNLQLINFYDIHRIMQYVSVLSNHALTGIVQHWRLSMNMQVWSPQC